MSEARPALGGRPIRARSQHDPRPTHIQDRRPPRPCIRNGRPRRRRCSEEMDRQGIPAVDAFQGPAAQGDGVVHQCRQTVPRHGDQRAVGNDPDARIRVQGPGQGLRGDHRDQGQPPGPRRRRGGAGGPDADADEPEPVRRLHQRLRPDRHPRAAAVSRQPHRLDGRRRKRRHAADAGRQRLHWQVVHHRAGRQAVAAARPAVREPLLVPVRLVQATGAEEGVQGALRLRAGRPARLVRLRRHRGVLHRAREEHRWRARVRPHGLRQACA